MDKDIHVCTTISQNLVFSRSFLNLLRKLLASNGFLIFEKIADKKQIFRLRSHPAKQQPIVNFRAFSCLFVVKKWVVGASPRQVALQHSCLEWLLLSSVCRLLKHLSL